MTEKFTFFWRGPFSQWHPCLFVVDRIAYNCAEQYMMAEKARMFGDKETELAIMSTSNPQEQKKLGRQVKNFSPVLWDEKSYLIVYRGNLAKFSQNPGLLKMLLGTKYTTLVEASPYDKIWGIGLKEDDHRALSRDTWQGENRLGRVLDAVRHSLDSAEAVITVSKETRGY